MITVTDDITLDESKIEERFIRSPGPGGQNVNKVATAVQLRFDAARSDQLTRNIFERLKQLSGRRMTRQGILIISASRHRTRERNRQDALQRLIALIREAAVPPKHRRPTRPTLAAKRRRVDAKKRRGDLKRGRGKNIPLD
jgi:ribosome-associated protein